MEGIKRVRKAKGVSLTALAARCGMLSQAVAYAERPGTDPRASTLKRLADALSVSVNAFFEEERTHARRRRRRRAR
jgi:transcriptional regulator with XRE-family HTH domain